MSNTETPCSLSNNADSHYFDGSDSLQAIAYIIIKKRQEKRPFVSLNKHYKKFQFFCPTCLFSELVIAPDEIDAFEFANQKHRQKQLNAHFHINPLQCTPVSSDFKSILAQ